MMLTVLWLGLGCAQQAEEPVQQAARIVSLGSPVTELVYALGRGDSLVGRDSSSLFPEEALALPDVGYHRQLSAEGVLSLAPSLVLATAHAGPPEAIEQLRAAGVTVLLLPEEATAEGARARGQLAPERLPKVQKVKARSCSSLATNSKSPVPDEAKALTATPQSSKVEIGAAPSRRATAITTPQARSPPTMAATGRPTWLHAPPSTVAAAPPKAAPLETPSRPGSARGLRVSPCISAPARPKAPPTR